MSVSAEAASLGSAIGNIPDVHNQTSVRQTVTVVGTGQATISVNDVVAALKSQNTGLTTGTSYANLYIHEIRAYGTAGGYLSMAPYPHKQFLTPTVASGASIFINSGPIGSSPTSPVAWQLTQMYDFGVAGSSRPTLKWSYPKMETINSPFTVGDIAVDSTNVGFNSCNVCTVQSTNTAGDALHIVQFDVTFQPNTFIAITSLLSAAAFGEENVPTDAYKTPIDNEKRIKEAEKAYATANKKRKVKHVKDMTMPSRDV